LPKTRTEELWLYPLSSSALDGSGWSTTRPGRFTSEKEPRLFPSVFLPEFLYFSSYLRLYITYTGTQLPQ